MEYPLIGGDAHRSIQNILIQIECRNTLKCFYELSIMKGLNEAQIRFKYSE